MGAVGSGGTRSLRAQDEARLKAARPRPRGAGGDGWSRSRRSGDMDESGLTIAWAGALGHVIDPEKKPL
ncbi:hypothetical protein ABXN37_27400 [Piscinibacter sakaiensis]|uniref:Uncharacterized protein n=1 Tax=Piscinibacter sakaiensis TaxID=1547922 RepID=A0A0K8P828_PISS1|nr:hypothetical protein [Piscinibacter sakaiensis]GAP38813.1 hypothetical protein ISF6_5472 [Piscinibacter sakaiensis]